MVKPISLRFEDADVRKARPAVYLYRAAAATLRSYLTGATPTDSVRALYGHDPVTDLILQRAAVPPAEITGTSGWASSLAGVAIYDMINDAATFSAGAELINRGLKLSLFRSAASKGDCCRVRESARREAQRRDHQRQRHPGSCHLGHSIGLGPRHRLRPQQLGAALRREPRGHQRHRR